MARALGLSLLVLTMSPPSAAAHDEPRVEIVDVRPQPGPQELFARTPADVAIIGGSLYGGKTWSLIIEPLRNVDVPGFNFVAFRREDTEITRPGGMWDESLKWYPQLGGTPREHTREWLFEDGLVRGKFSGLQFEKDLDSWKGPQICCLLFDQLESFTERQFFFMLSRNRSTCGVPPYTRASCNPDPDSFLAKLLAWWIDEDGWAIPKRSGSIRWFVRVNDEIVWAATVCDVDDYDHYEAKKAQARHELEKQHRGVGRFAKSITFVLARLQDNKIGQALDPEYEGNIRLMSHVEQERLLGGDRGGNWKIRPTAGKVFNRGWFKLIDASPVKARRVRYWDKAGTKGGHGAQTAGVRLALCSDGRVIIEDVVTGRWGAGERERTMKQVAEADGPAVTIWVEQEPGSGGKESAESSVINLGRFAVYADRVSGDKVLRANPLSAQAFAGNVYLLKGAWNEPFLKEAHQFPDGALKDQIDAAAGAYNKLQSSPVGGGHHDADPEPGERF